MPLRDPDVTESKVSGESCVSACFEAVNMAEVSSVADCGKQWGKCRGRSLPWGCYGLWHAKLWRMEDLCGF